MIEDLSRGRYLLAHQDPNESKDRQICPRATANVPLKIVSITVRHGGRLDSWGNITWTVLGAIKNLRRTLSRELWRDRLDHGQSNLQGIPDNVLAQGLMQIGL
jgi:hypothetical protein